MDLMDKKRRVLFLYGMVLLMANGHSGNQAVMRSCGLGISRTLFARYPFSLSDNLGV